MTVYPVGAGYESHGVIVELIRHAITALLAR